MKVEEPSYSGVIERGRKFLLSTMNADGGWPYLPGKPSSPEPTCYAMMAVAGGPRSAAWIENRVESAARSGEPDAPWTTSLALLALTRLRAPETTRKRLASRLLTARVQHVESGPVLEFDGTLRGWAWVEQTFSWVEPTCYALLALKAAGITDHERVREAERLLIDRVCSDGGWNCGTPNVLGAQLPSMMGPTALAAMALQGAGSSSTIVQKAMDLLTREVSAHPSALSASLAALCFHCHDRSTTPVLQILAKRQQPDGSWREQTHLTALAVLAFRAAEEGSNVFKV